LSLRFTPKLPGVTPVIALPKLRLQRDLEGILLFIDLCHFEILVAIAESILEDHFLSLTLGVDGVLLPA